MQMSSSPSNSPSGSQASPSGATTASAREGAPPAKPLTKLAGGPTPRAAASAAAPSDSPSHVPCSITAKQWDTVAVWSWDVQTKVCAICKGNLADQCISCQAQGSATEKPAPAAHGSAGVAGAAVGGARGPASVGGSGSSTGASATASASAAPAAAARRSAGGLAQGPGPANTTAAARHSTPATLADLSDKCCVAWGTCGHVFHYHCVSRWLQMRSMCPVCGRPWQLHKITSNE